MFFRVSFFWCLASTQRVCRRPRILLSEAEALRVMLGRSRDPGDGPKSIRDEFLHYVKISSKWDFSSSTFKVEFLKIWTFVCPELGICGQAYFKVKVYSSDQLILLYRMWETNEKPIKNWWFFGVSFSAPSLYSASLPPAENITLRAEALRVIPSGSPWDLGAGSRPEVSTYSKWCPGKILCHSLDTFELKFWFPDPFSS